MTEPNRLRDEAASNAYRTGLRADQPSPVPMAARVRSIGSRRVFIGGLVIAVIGIPFFFGPGLRFQEIGLGLITLGVGVALLTATRRTVIDDIAAARRSKGQALALLVSGPHTVILGAIALGLIGFGLLVLAIGIGLI